MINLVPHYRTVFKRLICSRLLPFHQRVLVSCVSAECLKQIKCRGKKSRNWHKLFILYLLWLVFSFSGDSTCWWWSLCSCCPHYKFWTRYFKQDGDLFSRLIWLWTSFHKLCKSLLLESQRVLIIVFSDFLLFQFIWKIKTVSVERKTLIRRFTNY